MPPDNDAKPNDNGVEFQKQVEFYKQLHETCRHHYRLEWQLLQVGVIVSLGVLTFGFKSGDSDLRGWLLIASGFALVWISYAMHRQSLGYLKANKSLVHYAHLIGDPNVKKPQDGLRSAAFQGRLIPLVVGSFLIGYGIWICPKLPEWSRYTIIGIVEMIPLYIAYETITARKKIEKS